MLRIIYTAWLLGVENIIVHGNHIHVEEYHCLTCCGCTNESILTE